MSRPTRKLGASDPFASYNRSKRKRYALPVTTGFVWAYAGVAIARNRDQIENILQQSGFGPRVTDPVHTACAGFLILTFCAALFLLTRLAYPVRRTSGRDSGKKRGPAGLILIGMTAAIVYAFTPPEIWSQVTDLFGDPSHDPVASTSLAVQEFALDLVGMDPVVDTSHLN